MYDLEVVIPVSNKYKDRIKDLKKIGFVNVLSRRVLVSLIVSGETIEDLETGWPEGVDVRVSTYSPGTDYIQNTFEFFLSNSFSGSRWISRMDDDSCTDVDSLISNLDEFYDFNEVYYLAGGFNTGAWHDDSERYSDSLGPHKRIIEWIGHETECCVVSWKCIDKMQSDERSRRVMSARTKVKGGVSDCALAFAAAAAKIYAISCPFITNQPEIENFHYVTGGIRCHIHLIRRSTNGETSELEMDNRFKIISKFAENNPTELEKSLFGKKFVCESNDGVFLYLFDNRFGIKIKFDNTPRFFFEENGLIKIATYNSCETFRLEGGKLVGRDKILEPVSA
jgi:hypothetical protein